MDCFQDFCLFCDRESHDGPYCSQACKLADLERSNASSPNSPLSPNGSGSSAAWSSSSVRPHVHSNSLSYHVPTGSDGRQSQSSYFMWATAQQASTESPEQGLTPSSSRTSLSSTISMSQASTSPGLSLQAQNDLQGYFTSFDQARAAKRRSSLR